MPSTMAKWLTHPFPLRSPAVDDHGLTKAGNSQASLASMATLQVSLLATPSPRDVAEQAERPRRPDPCKLSLVRSVCAFIETVHIVVPSAATPDLPRPEKAIRSPILLRATAHVHRVPAPDFPSNWFGVILEPHTI
ncbi:hypothetical protein FALBO_9256 [Fusarium albosuccineum]|uniref:Uncharacterized protein n=1 Tax=Fusarium albosuccineum TaxID=1237068 RepID=A0A8H4L6P8_9HYPO|nr:hypothetical protein FALBO_9256 [Fusarium albosuccineum]